MVPSGPMVGDAPLPMPLAPLPPPPGPAPWLVTSGVGPRCSPKSKVHLTWPWGETAYILPSELGWYTVPSAPSAGADLMAGPTCARHLTEPSSAIANNWQPLLAT